MSFRSSSAAFARSYTFTNLELNGGYDCSCSSPVNKGVDLFVHGGARIKKTVCAGNICVSGLIVGDLCGNILTERIQEKEATQGIDIIGNLRVAGDITPTETDTYNLGTTTNKWKQIVVQDLLVCGNLSANVVSNVTTLLNCSGALPQTQCIVDNGIGPNLTVKGLVPGTNITLTDVGTDIIIDAASTNGWVGNATSNLNMFCYTISNVMSLYVHNVYGKPGGTDINVQDALYMRDTVSGGKIKYEAGIEVGDNATLTADSVSISIGKNGLATGSNSIVLGTNATTVGHSSIAAAAGAVAGEGTVTIGRNAVGTSWDSVVLGRYAQSLFGTAAYNTVAIGRQAVVESLGSVSVGGDSHVYTNSAFAVNIGDGAKVNTNSQAAISVGRFSTAAERASVAIGGSLAFIPNTGAYTKGYASIAIGGGQGATYRGAYAESVGSIAIGGAVQTSTAKAAHTRSDFGIALGTSSYINTNSPLSISMGFNNQIKTNSPYSISAGYNSYVGSNSQSSIVMGKTAIGRSPDLIVMGTDARTFDTTGSNNPGADQSIIIGRNTRINSLRGNGDIFQSYNSIAMGTNAYIRRSRGSTAIGFNSKISSVDGINTSNCIVVGTAAYSALATDCISIGSNARVYSNRNVTIGPSAKGPLGSNNCVAIGNRASNRNIGMNPNNGSNQIAIGNNAGTGHNGCIAIGTYSFARKATAPFSARYAICIGGGQAYAYGSFADSDYTIAVGSGTRSSSYGAIAIGTSARVGLGNVNSIAIGTGITAIRPGGFFVRHRSDASLSLPAAWIGNELVDATSSRRFKQNIRDLETVGDKIDMLRPVRFNAKPEYGDASKEQIGFIAEEVKEVFPEFVVIEEDGVTAKGIAFDRMVSILVKEIQALRKEISDIKVKLN